MDMILVLDKKIFFMIHELSGNAWLDYPMVLLSYLTRTRCLLLMVPIAVLIFIKKDKLKKILFFIIASFALDLIVHALKDLFARARPFNAMPELVEVVETFGRPSSYSFPSGHATIIFFTAVLFNQIFDRKWLWPYALALAVALDRVYLGVHYPVDILVGSILGWGLGHLAVLLANKTIFK